MCDWYSPRFGGIEAHLDGLASRLTASGYEVHVITSTPGTSGLRDGVIVHRLSAARLPVVGVVFEPTVVAEIASILKRERIELVHSHVSIVAPVGLGGGLAAHRLGLPSVMTFHSFVPATPLWARIAGLSLGTGGWNSVMTAVSSRVLREVSAFAPGHPFVVLPNAIDTDFWTPGERRAITGPVTLLYAGRLNAKKKPFQALRTAREFKRVAPAVAFRLLICGSGPLEARMRRFVKSEGLDDVVDFLGWCDRVSLRELIRSSDVFLSPADRESFGIAALEARSGGLPVVAMKDSAVSDFITHGRSGILVESATQFASAVVSLANDREALASMGEHCRSERTELSWESSLSRHIAIYASAVTAAA